MMIANPGKPGNLVHYCSVLKACSPLIGYNTCGSLKYLQNWRYGSRPIKMQNPVHIILALFSSHKIDLDIRYIQVLLGGTLVL